MNITAVRLVNVGSTMMVDIEHDGKWFTIIRTKAVCEQGHVCLPISHICESSGLENAKPSRLDVPIVGS